MNALHKDYRDDLEKAVSQARTVAEAGARAALHRLTVADAKPVGKLTDAQRTLRNRLRAKARSLGDPRNKTTATQAVDRLIREIAYEHWHRMLFARFLAQNDLLIHPEYDTAVSLADVKELAKKDKAGGGDPWELAASYASAMLPQIFRQGDPALSLTFAPEHRQALEALVEGLHPDVFDADDSLGWVYQYWQKDEKDRVNKSGHKITGDTLPAVTQLFTEHYMVQFLIDNTLGAWWAGKHLDKLAGADDEAQCRRRLALPGYTFDYLRLLRDETTQAWTPAAGTFDGWPRHASELKILDPCCGSGHFLVAVLRLLVRLRIAEEGLALPDAIDAVLTDNLHGLELDARCTQLAAFNVAFTAWRLAGSWKKLPRLNIACTGLAPNTPVERWHKLAKPLLEGKPSTEQGAVRLSLDALHALFTDAPTLGSLIDVTGDAARPVGAADFETVEPYLREAMSHEYENGEEGGADDLHADAVTSAGIADAARLLGGDYTLVITNVPYLGRGNQNDRLKGYIDAHHKLAKADLATAFLDRGLGWLSVGASGDTSGDTSEGTSGGTSGGGGGTIAAVTPQNWLFLTSYKKLRERLLKNRTWNAVARLGPGAFETIGGHVVNVALVAISADEPDDDHAILGLDASGKSRIPDKAALLRDGDDLRRLPQAGQLEQPDAIVSFEELTRAERLDKYCESLTGAHTLDIQRFRLTFWEVRELDDFNFHQSTPDGISTFSGYNFISAKRDPGTEFDLTWTGLKNENRGGAPFAGQPAWGRMGVACGWMGSLPATIYVGGVYDNSIAVLLPADESHLLPIWTYASSPDYLRQVRVLNQKTQVANTTLAKVPFDIAHWQAVANEKYPDGLPEPESDDPTQWLFHGRPEASEGHGGGGGGGGGGGPGGGGGGGGWGGRVARRGGAGAGLPLAGGAGGLPARRGSLPVRRGGLPARRGRLPARRGSLPARRGSARGVGSRGGEADAVVGAGAAAGGVV